MLYRIVPVQRNQRNPGGQPLALRPRIETPRNSISPPPLPPPPPLFSLETAVRRVVSSYVCTQEEQRSSQAIAIGRLAAGHVYWHRCHGSTAIVFPPARSHPGVERDRNPDRAREKGGSGVHRWDNCGTRTTENRLHDGQILADEIRRDRECSGGFRWSALGMPAMI
jgi:hypothetical protein